MEVRMDLVQIRISETQESQLILLRERDGDRVLPIVIGINEALAIDRRVKGHIQARPLTHELLSNVIHAMGGELERIVIHDLRETTFYAKLVVRLHGSLVEVDSRPSDAIAVGIGAEVPIYVEDAVLNRARHSA